MNPSTDSLQWDTVYNFPPKYAVEFVILIFYWVNAGGVLILTTALKQSPPCKISTA